MLKITSALRTVALTSLACATAWSAVAGANHVVVLGFDGLYPPGIVRGDTPVMHAMMKRGTYSLKARGVLPNNSSPNWASMIMGAGPTDHGVTSNDWEPNDYQIPPVCVGTGGIFPTIFGVLRQQRPKAVIGVFHDWIGFPRLMEQKAADVIKHGNGPDETMALAIEFVKHRKPTFVFVHCDHVDHAGHKFGWGTPEYLAAVAKADVLVGKMLDALDEAGIGKETIVLITADHGGVGTKHNCMDLACIEIPWILTGPGVTADKEAPLPLRTTDTAATIAYIFGLTPPACWTGKPVLAAFSLK